MAASFAVQNFTATILTCQSLQSRLDNTVSRDHHLKKKKEKKREKKETDE